jgi:poly(A) polymerase
MLQARFAHRTKKRAMKLLEHPRFRAAYDFLVLRAEESSELAELAQWWTQAQEIEHTELAERLAAPVPTNTDVAPKPKRRRARRRRPKASNESGAPADLPGGE